MKRTLLITTALSLVLPATAAAKEISGLQACGASGCAKLHDAALLARVGEGSDGSASAPAPALQPYFRLVYTVTAAPGENFGKGRKQFTFTGWYVPGAHVTQGVNEGGYIVWSPVTPEFEAALADLTSKLRPYPTPRLTGVRVGDRWFTRGAATYARLLTAGTPTGLPSGDDDWQSIWFFSKRPTPWTRGGTLMDFSAKTKTLYRGGSYFKLAGSDSGAVAAGRALSTGGGSFPWWTLALGLALSGLAVLLAARLLRPRKSGQPLPRPETA